VPPSAPTDVVERVLRQEAALFRIASLAHQTLETRLREIIRVDATTLAVARVSFWTMCQTPDGIRCDSLYLLDENRYENGAILTAEDFPRYFEALRTGRAIPAHNAHEDSRTSEFSTGYLAPNGIGAMLDVPVFLDGELHGVVCHEHVGGARSWTRDEQLFAMSVGQAIALSIEAERRDQTERRFRAILEASPVPMVVSSLQDGRLVYGNAAMANLYGVSADRIPGSRGHSFYADPAERDSLIAELEKEGRIVGRELRLKRSDGSYYWAMVSIGRAELDGKPVLITSVWDVTPKREAEEKLRKMALYDDLTGLANRVLLFDLLRTELARADRHDHQLAVLYLDLDHFKSVNDRLGHEAGDAVLKAAAERIRHGLRAGDVPARVGGDEFVVLLPKVTGLDAARSVAARVADALAEPHTVAGNTLVCPASVGLLLAGRNYTDPSVVLRDADAAMYTAKHAGKSRIHVFGQDQGPNDGRPTTSD
jgi:diguanylate cyclase (GGDEF)-like protein/PAS domain S-box-containing protein